MATENMDLDSMWDEAFGADEEDTETATDEGQVNETQTDGADSGESASEGGQNTGSAAPRSGMPLLTADDLAEINAELGTNYTDPSEFAQARRYVELRENGKFSAKEALAAVGASSQRKSSETVGTGKGHITASRNRGSNGEVMTSADMEELSKWGFKTQGKELEALWKRSRG